MINAAVIENLQNVMKVKIVCSSTGMVLKSLSATGGLTPVPHVLLDFSSSP
jgi:hypothetical protein